MALLEIHPDLKRTAEALERIAAVLERAFPARIDSGQKFTAADYSLSSEDALIDAELKQMIRERFPETPGGNDRE